MKTTDSQNELLDVVDDSDNIISQATRRECHKRKLRHKTTGAFVFDNNWRIFITQRSKTKDMEPLYWSISSGGHVQSGDSYEKTIKRELKEELGITKEPKFIKIIRNDTDEELENSARYYMVTNQKLKINKEEIKQGRFVTFEELEEFMKKERFTNDTKNVFPILVSLLKEKKDS
jgi:isopentenyl-diphosphate delta-isomerase type 1